MLLLCNPKESSVGNLMAEMALRSTKKCNIVLQGLPTNTGDEKNRVTPLLDDELHVKFMIVSLSRLGRGGPSGPPPLLVTLSKEEDAR